MKILPLSLPQNDRLCEVYKYQFSYFDWLKNYNLKHKFMIFSPVANLMHHPLHRFKGLGMRNLQYEMRICQKSHIKVTVYVWFKFLWIRRQQRNSSNRILNRIRNRILNRIEF
jgi:hypothetical protein